MKKIIAFILATFTPFVAFADGRGCGWQGMMGLGNGWGNGMMGSFMGGSFFFLAPLGFFAFWVLVLALLVALVRWVWKKGDEKK